MKQRSDTDRRQDNGQDQEYAETDRRQEERRGKEKTEWEKTHPDGHSGHPYS